MRPASRWSDARDRGGVMAQRAVPSLPPHPEELARVGVQASRRMGGHGLAATLRDVSPRKRGDTPQREGGVRLRAAYSIDDGCRIGDSVAVPGDVLVGTHQNELGVIEP